MTERDMAEATKELTRHDDIRKASAFLFCFVNIIHYFCGKVG